jgi:DNA-binding transcriptional regulator YdaS (Cro superfamily)
MPRAKKRRRYRQAAQLNPGLRLAVEAVGGRMSYLAKKIKLTPQAVGQWTEIPPNRVIAVERVTKIPREKLRPDLYPQRRSRS